MNEPLSAITALIHQIIPIDSDEWSDYSSLFTIMSVSKKQHILKQNEHAKAVYFVNKGLFRVYFVDEYGEEKTFHFAIENSFVTDYKSVLKQTPATYSIQALEDAEIVIMSREQLFYGYERLKYGDRLGRLLAEQYFFLFNDKLEEIYTQSPIERYRTMQHQFPGLIQRVPQHMIASYLNISPVHLSRLKNATD